MHLLATIGDQQLYLEDLSYRLTDVSNRADSLAIIDAETELWLRDAAFKHEAKKQVDSDPSIDRQVNHYRDDLLMHAYEEKILAEANEENVSDATLLSFFNKNRSLFPKASPVVSFEWVKASVDAKGVTSFFESWEARKNIDFNKICKSRQVECWISSDEYHLLDLLKEKIPGGWYSKKDFEKKKRKQKNINGYEFFLNIVDYKEGNDKIVFQESKELVTRLYNNQKNVQFLQDEKERLYKETQKQNLIKKYIIE